MPDPIAEDTTTADTQLDAPVDVEVPVNVKIDPNKRTLEVQVADISVAPAAELISADMPQITNYARSSTGGGETVVSYSYGGATVEQTMKADGPGILMFDPTTTNFVFIPLRYPEGLQFVELIT